MNDTLYFLNDSTRALYQLASGGMGHDSIHVSDTSGNVAAFFRGGSPAEIWPVWHHPPEGQWFIYVLLFFMLGTAVIWYSIPERLTTFFSISVKTIIGKSGQKESENPGALVTTFFLLNSWVMMSFLMYLTLTNIATLSSFAELEPMQKIMVPALFILLFTAVKLLIIRVLGIIFKTGEMARKQQIIYMNSYHATGVILLPMLFLWLIIPSNDFLYLILAVVAVIILYRWIQTAIIGINITHFRTFHLILYLCTLEIIPILILLKIVM